MKKQKPKTLKDVITERDIKRQVKEYLKWNGWFSFNIVQGIGSDRGAPDRVAIKDGKVLFIEVKKPSGELSEAQKKFQDNIQSHGGNYIVVRSIEDLENAIKKIFEKKEEKV